MISYRLKKQVARFLVWVMMLTNMSPAFTIPDYQVFVRQSYDAVSTNCSLQIEAFKATEQPFKEAEKTMYEMVFNQTMLMMSAILSKAQKISPERVVNIEVVGKFKLDEHDAIVIDSDSWLDPGKTILFTTDRNVIINSLMCDNINISAPNVTFRGESFIKSLGISISNHDGVLAIEEKAKLSTENASVFGRFFNNGLLNLLGDDAHLSLNDSDLCNRGVISGNSLFLQQIGYFLNEGRVYGKNINVQVNALANKNKIGNDDASVTLAAYKSISNSGKILSKSAKFTATSREKAFTNDGDIRSSAAEFQLAGQFQNNGRVVLGDLSGHITRFMNDREFFARSGQ